MSSKRKYEEPSAIVYGSETPWLRPFLQKPTDLDSGSDQGPNISPPASNIAAFPDNDVVFETAKVAYLLNHNLDPSGNLSGTLKAIDAGPSMPKHKAWLRKISQKQTQWKAAILHKFLVSHVEEVIHAWHVANAWKTFGALSQKDREKVWLAEYDSDPRGISTKMWKPVIGVLDMANTFNGDLVDVDDRRNTSAVRVMLRNKYLFGCEITFNYRSQDGRNDPHACSRAWGSYADMDGFSDTIVPAEDLPISSKTMSDQLAQQKKQKVQAFDEVEI